MDLRHPGTHHLSPASVPIIDGKTGYLGSEMFDAIMAVLHAVVYQVLVWAGGLDLSYSITMDTTT